MRRERLARIGSWLGVLAAGLSGSCGGAPEQLFDSAGAAGLAGAPSAGTSAGGASQGGALPSTGGASVAAGGTVVSTGGTSQGGATAVAGGGTVGFGGAKAAGGVGGISVASGGSTLGSGGVGGSNLPSEIVQQITKNSDDCTFIMSMGQYQERLRYSDTDQWLEVGNDAEMGRIGLRFVLPIPPKATIVSASLQLQRVSGTALSTDTMTIQVYDTGNVPIFDATHHHGPAAHASQGLYATAIRGTLMGENGKPVTTADLKLLVQRVVDRSDFGMNGTMGTIGFVLAPELTASWAAYGDSSNGNGATLRVSYRPLPGG